MREEKIFFRNQISFQGVLSSLSSALLECGKNKDLDERIIATWNANICSCAHRCELDSLIDVPFGVSTDDSMLVLGMIYIKQYGKISLIINQPKGLDGIAYRIPYDVTVLGIIFEDNTSQEKKNSVVMALHDILNHQVMNGWNILQREKRI